MPAAADVQSAPMAYELHYWPTIQGRGEFVRLALEAAGAPYIDVARGAERSAQGLPAMLRYLADDAVVHPPFAPPFLKDGSLLVGQTALILQYLGPKLKLVARAESARLWTQQIQLTIADIVAEAHDTHHPVATSRYYEEQKAEAVRRARDFCDHRVAKYLGWFERILERNPAGPRHLVGGRLSYADLSLFQLVDGLRYAFPRAAEQALAKTPAVVRLRDRVAGLPRIEAYLQSDRRVSFNEQGIFRRYPELDID